MDKRVDDLFTKKYSAESICTLVDGSEQDDQVCKYWFVGNVMDTDIENKKITMKFIHQTAPDSNSFKSSK